MKKYFTTILKILKCDFKLQRFMISNFIPQMDFINVNTDFICLIKIQLVHKLVLILSLNHIKEL